MTDASYKRCPRCERTLPLCDFARDRSKRSGHTPHCKACINAKSKRYYSEHRDERLAYARRKAKVRSAEPKLWEALQPRTCEACTSEYQPQRKDQRYCVACRTKYKWRGATATAECHHCGATVRRELRKMREDGVAYCGKSCASKARAHLRAKVCVRNRMAIVGPVPRTITASGPVCLLKDAPAVGHRIAGSCRQCGKSFVSRGLWATGYCSKRCGKRAAGAARKVRKRGAKKSGRVYRTRVFERDHWTCRLCRKPIDRAAVVPDPYAGTLDHILPLVLGGAHEYSNVQAAHFICNSRKGDRVDQLAFAA